MAQFSDHYANSSVPQAERRGPVTMGLLWITMITSFPTVLIGFEWFKVGITLPQVLIGAVVSGAILLAYTVPAAHLGALTGNGYGQMNKQVFGERVGIGINLMLIAMFIGFYGLAALLLAQALDSLFHFPIPIAPIASVIALLMALNNFFGFSGVANFARFVAAPILIFWVGYTAFKAVQVCPMTVLQEAPKHSLEYSLGVICPFVIGFAIWGNETDYWRYAKARVSYSAIPLSVAVVIGMLIFPAVGWMVAKISGITDYAAATNFMTTYSFGGVVAFGAMTLAASYFAMNDSNLFGSSTAFETIWKVSHKKAVAVLALLGAVTAYGLSIFGAEKSLEAIASLNCIFLPTPTIVVMTSFCLSKAFERHGYAASPSTFSASIAMAVGIAVGLATSGVIPGTQMLQCGIPCLQAWMTSIFVFSVLRSLEYKRASRYAISSIPVSDTVDYMLQKI